MAPFPRVIREEDISGEVEGEFQYMQDVVYAIRNIRGEVSIPPSMATDLYVEGPAEQLERNQAIVESLIKIADVQVPVPRAQPFIRTADNHSRTPPPPRWYCNTLPASHTLVR